MGDLFYKVKSLFCSSLIVVSVGFVLSYSSISVAKDISSKVNLDEESTETEAELENEIGEIVKENTKKQNKDIRDQVMAIDRRINTESAITCKDYSKPLTKDELAIKHRYNAMISNENGVDVIVSRDESKLPSKNESTLASNFSDVKEEIIAKDEKDPKAEDFILKAQATKKLNKQQKLKVIKKEIEKKNKQEESAKRRKRNVGTSSLSNSFSN